LLLNGPINSLIFAMISSRFAIICFQNCYSRPLPRHAPHWQANKAQKRHNACLVLPNHVLSATLLPYRGRPFGEVIMDEGSKWPDEVVYALGTTQRHHVQLSVMADNKANMLIGATFVVFTLAIGQSQAGNIPYRCLFWQYPHLDLPAWRHWQ
jgi:hypothetical protein